MPKRSPVPAMTKNADPQSRIGVRCTPDSFQTFRRSTPVPSKSTLHLAVLIPTARSFSNLKGCPNSCVE